MNEIFLVTVTTYTPHDQPTLYEQKYQHLVQASRKIGANEAVLRHYQKKVDSGEIKSFDVYFHETLF